METKKEITCCFTGHRLEKLPWSKNEDDPRCRKLRREIWDVLLAVYDSGYRHFLCGMATGCDMYFGEAVVALRDEKADVTLEAAIPFAGQSERWNSELKKRYFRLAESCDELHVLRQEYTPECMMERNRYMVDRSGLVIAAYNGSKGGTQRTMLYALRRNIRIIQIELPQ